MKATLYILFLGVLLTEARSTQVVEAAGFEYVVDDSYVKQPHPGKRLAPDTYFDSYVSRELGFGVGGQAWRVNDWQTVKERAIEKIRKEIPIQFTSELIEVSEKSDSGEPITIVYARTDDERVPVFFFYSFKTAPHAWIVYFVPGHSKEPADYLAFARSVFKTVKVTAPRSAD